VEWHQGHLNGDQRLVQQALQGVGTIFHLAGQTSVAVARQDPRADHLVNVGGMARLIAALRSVRSAPTVVFAGTVTQSGVIIGERLDESAPDQPVTEYDRHKLEAETLLEEASREGILRGVTLRLANVYGPGSRSSASDRGVLNRMIRSAAAGQPLRVFGDGQQVRDYSYVTDVIEAFMLAAERSTALAGRHFVVGSGHGRSIADLVTLVAARAEAYHGRTVPITFEPVASTAEPIDARSYAVDATAFTQATGWTPSVGMADGIDRTLRWIGDTSCDS